MTDPAALPFHPLLLAGRHLGLLLMLLAPAWMAASRLSAIWRSPMGWLGLGNLLFGAGLVLASAVAARPGSGVAAAALALQVAGHGSGWMAAQRLAGASPAGRVPLALLQGIGLAAAVATLLVGPGEAAGQAFLVALLSMGATMLLAAVMAARRLWPAGRHRLAAGVLAAGVVYGAGAAGRAIADPRAGLPWADGGGAPVLATAGLLLPLLVNLAFCLHVFERVAHAVRRLAARDPLTGLPQRSTVEQVLAFEAAMHQRDGRRMAMLALRATAPDGARADHDPVMAAELARWVRMRLAPGDELGLADDGLLLVCLFNTDEPSAARMLALLTAPSPATGARWPGAEALRLHGAMLMVEPHDHVGTAVEVVRQRCLRGSTP